MARFIDDTVLANINSIIFVKSQDIVTHVFSSKDILTELLEKMRNNDDVLTKINAFEFFLEVCSLSKNT